MQQPTPVVGKSYLTGLKLYTSLTYIVLEQGFICGEGGGGGGTLCLL